MKTVDQALLPIFKTLDADTTLRGYLGGAGHIYKSPTRPAGAANPALTMRLLPFDIQGEQSHADESFVWLNLFLDNKQDMTPDTNKGHLVETRIETLIGGQYLTDSGTTVKVERHLPGRILPIDPEAKNEHAWNFQYRIIAK
jgi:hypothetical protein